MVREALDYIKRNHLSETVIKHPDRAEASRVANFPYDAVEEAVVNAIYHRSYEEREPVEIRITPEELAVLSFPGPDRSISLDQLRSGRAATRRYRNRRIGEFLKELDLTEGRATGIPKILGAMRENGSPPPEFESDADRSSFLIRLPAHSLAQSATGENMVSEAPERATAHRPEWQKRPEWRPESIHDRIMTVIALAPASTSEISAALGHNVVSGALKQALLELRELGFLEYTLPGKPRSSLQQYRVSASAKSDTSSLHTSGKNPDGPLPKADSAPNSDWRSRPEWRPEWRPESIHDRIMAIIANAPASKAEIARALGHNAVSGAMKQALVQLRAQGLIEYTTPEKPQSRLQKYRISKI